MAVTLWLHLSPLELLCLSTIKAWEDPMKKAPSGRVRPEGSQNARLGGNRAVLISGPRLADLRRPGGQPDFDFAVTRRGIFREPNRLDVCLQGSAHQSVPVERRCNRVDPGLRQPLRVMR